MIKSLLLSLIFVATGLLGAAPVWGQSGDLDPYVVFVAHEGAYTRCGPAGDYYRTDPLRLGQELEVYLETDDGWLGVRPPTGSFSWVPAEQVEAEVDETAGVVIREDAVAWIGTHLGRARKYQWQVQLAVGEPVTILGKAQRNAGSGPQMWYRIAPPSGEFRWVHRSQIAETSEELVQMHRKIEDPDPEKEIVLQPVEEPVIGEVPRQRPRIEAIADDNQGSSTETGEPTERETPRIQRREVPSRDSETVARQKNEQPSVPEISNQPIGSGVARDRVTAATYAQPLVEIDGPIELRDIRDSMVKPASAAVPPPTVAPDDDSWVTAKRNTAQRPLFVPRNARRASQRQASADVSRDAASMHDQTRPASQPRSQAAAADRQSIDEAEQQSRAVAARVVSSDVDSLQLELSRQMAAGVRAAVVEPIRQRAHDWMQRLSDPVARGRARVLMERVEQYQRIARRRDGEPPVAAPLGTPDASATPSPTGIQEAALPERFDREGYLVQVYSSRPDAPPFALTDAAGKTLAYVSAAPGVNLHLYRNAKVGLVGRENFLTGLETPHFIASQAVRIGRDR